MTDLFDEVVQPGGPVQREPRSRESRRAQQRRRQRQRRRRSTIAMLISLVLIGGVAYAAFQVIMPLILDRGNGTDEVTDFPGPGSGSATVVVEPGASGAAIGAAAVEAGVVATQQAFIDAFNANSNASGIQPGTYELMEGMRAADAVAALLDPANRVELLITIPEGFRDTQVYERLAARAEIELDEVVATAADTESYGLPEAAEGNPEGWFAAATYRFQPGTDLTTMFETMVDQTVRTLEDLNVPEDQWQEVLIKASIVEREGLPQYFGEVARVIENRLVDTTQVNGRLQMDATVLYGDGQVGGMPTQAQLNDSENPYNTYRHAGLPPGPIGAPSREAIAAVLDPPEGDWLYFVTVNLDTGETKFASTLAEHDVNVAELREWERQQTQESQEQDETEDSDG